MTRAGLRLRFYPGVAADVRAELVRLAAGLRRLGPPAHRVAVTVVRHPALANEAGETGFGVFLVPPAPPARHRRPVRVVVAAGLADEVAGSGGTRGDGVFAVGVSFLHEWAHYEQWRSGRPVVERGVGVRARGLYARLGHPAGVTRTRGK